MPTKKSNDTKIAIPSFGKDIDSEINPRFGRCEYFLIFNQDGKLVKSISNTGAEARRGAGVSAAQSLAEQKVKAVIAGNIGPNAYVVLNSAGIEIFSGALGMNAEEAFKAWKGGKLTKVEKSPAFQSGFSRGRRFD